MIFTLNITTAAQKAEAARAALVSELANIRWQAETGGVTLPNGTGIPTDQQTRVSFTGAVNSLASGMMTAPVAWKMPNGWQDLSEAEINAAAAAVVAHVQLCFEAERAVQAQIEALTDAQISAFDVQAAFEAALAV